MLVTAISKHKIEQDENYRGFVLRKSETEKLIEHVNGPDGILFGCTRHKNIVGLATKMQLDESRGLITNILIDTSHTLGENAARDVENGVFKGASLQFINYPLMPPEREGDIPLIGAKVPVEVSLVEHPDESECVILSYERLTPDQFNLHARGKWCK